MTHTKTDPDPVLATITIADLRDRDACADALACCELIARDGVIEVRRSTLRPLVILCHRWIGWLVEREICPDLTGAFLYSANLHGANLAGADLHGANLAGAWLGGANLVGADLSGTNLGGASLSGAYLTDANLYGAILSGAILSGANLTNAYRPEGGIAGWAPDADGYLRRVPA